MNVPRVKPLRTGRAVEHDFCQNFVRLRHQPRPIGCADVIQAEAQPQEWAGTTPTLSTAALATLTPTAIHLVVVPDNQIRQGQPAAVRAFEPLRKPTHCVHCLKGGDFRATVDEQRNLQGAEWAPVDARRIGYELQSDVYVRPLRQRGFAVYRQAMEAVIL